MKVVIIFQVDESLSPKTKDVTYEAIRDILIKNKVSFVNTRKGSISVNKSPQKSIKHYIDVVLPQLKNYNFKIREDFIADIKRVIVTIKKRKKRKKTDVEQSKMRRLEQQQQKQQFEERKRRRLEQEQKMREQRQKRQEQIATKRLKIKKKIIEEQMKKMKSNKTTIQKTQTPNTTQPKEVNVIIDLSDAPEESREFVLSFLGVKDATVKDIVSFKTIDKTYWKNKGKQLEKQLKGWNAIVSVREDIQENIRITVFDGSIDDSNIRGTPNDWSKELQQTLKF
jgi:hypothetical protein